MKHRKRSKQFYRAASGTSILELAGSIFTFGIATVIAVNVGVLLFAAWRNDSACRDSARAAAQRNNYNDALGAAIFANKQFETSGGVFGKPLIVVNPDTFQYETFADPDTGRPDMTKGPFVRVTTRLDCKLLAPIVFNGVKFTDTISFSQSYVYPLLDPDRNDDADDSIDDALFAGEEVAVETENSDNTDGDDTEEGEAPTTTTTTTTSSETPTGTTGETASASM